MAPTSYRAEDLFKWSERSWSSTGSKMFGFWRMESNPGEICWRRNGCHQVMGISFISLFVPGKASCSCGLISNDEMVLFDPTRNISFYRKFAEKNGARIIKTFETHLQADYISGSKSVADDSGAIILGHENDFKNAAFDYTKVVDDQIYAFSKGGPQIKALHMPGHTPGSTSYRIDNQYLITGDTVFILSIGRPDLGGKAGEWSKLLYHTLKTKITEMDLGKNECAASAQKAP